MLIFTLIKICSKNELVKAEYSLGFRMSYVSQPSDNYNISSLFDLASVLILK